MLGIATAHAARPLTGTVVDAESATPVPHAVVTISETGASTLADNEGHFEFTSLPDGTYHLCGRRLGYEQRCDVTVTIGAEELSEITIYLEPEPLDFAAINVHGTRPADEHLTAAAQEIITSDQIDQTGAATAAEALERTSSVEVIRNSTGTATVSIRGGSPDGVAVIVDGVQLRSGQAVDLSSISAKSIESIAVFEGPAASGIGIDALAGAVVITTKRATKATKANLSTGIGSYGQSSTELALDGIGYHDQRLRLSWRNDLATGDFSYTDTLDAEFTRTNNDAHRQNFTAQAGGSIIAHWRWNGSVSHYRLRAGIPGALSQLTPQASRREKRYVYRAAVNNTHSDGDFELSYARTTDWNYYVNTATPVYETEYQSELDQWRGQYTGSSGILDGTLAAVEFSSEDLTGKDYIIPYFSFGTAERKNYSASLRYVREQEVRSPVVSTIRLTSAYRYDQTETEADYPTSILSPPIDPPQEVWRFGSPHIGIRAQGSVDDFAWTISGAYGKSFRRAPLLDMFWVESYRTRGNPGLKPERSEQSELGYSLRTKPFVTVTFSQRYFWSRYTDLIFWQPGQGGVWSPANIGRAHIDGREDQLSLAAFGNALSLDITHQDHDHINMSGEPNTDGQPLPLRYRHRTNISLRGDIGWGHAELARRSYGRRTLRAAATKWLDPYSVIDIAAGVRMEHIGIATDVTLRVENVGDTQYELIEREPMPGRSYRLNIEIKL